MVSGNCRDERFSQSASFLLVLSYFLNSWSNIVPLRNAPVRSKILCHPLLVIAGSPWKHCPHKAECFFHPRRRLGCSWFMLSFWIPSFTDGRVTFLKDWDGGAWLNDAGSVEQHCCLIIVQTVLHETMACSVLSAFPDEMFILEQQVCSCCSVVGHDLHIIPTLYHAVSS